MVYIFSTIICSLNSNFEENRIIIRRYIINQNKFEVQLYNNFYTEHNLRWEPPFLKFLIWLGFLIGVHCLLLFHFYNLLFEIKWIGMLFKVYCFLMKSKQLLNLSFFQIILMNKKKRKKKLNKVLLFGNQ